jgi:hypothetical protein
MPRSVPTLEYFLNAERVLKLAQRDSRSAGTMKMR